MNNNSLNTITIQVRIGICHIPLHLSSTQLAFTLAHQSIQSSLTPWKPTISNSVTFNSFLRISVPSSSKSKCSLVLYSRTNKNRLIVGKVNLNFMNKRYERVHKYSIKDESDKQVAIVEASIFIKFFEFSHPQPDALIYTEIMGNSNCSSINKNDCSLDFGSILGHLKIRETSQQKGLENKLMSSDEESLVNIYVDKTSMQKQFIRSKKLKISKEVNISIGKKQKIVSNIVNQLFSQITRHNIQITRRDTELGETKAKLNQKQVQIMHMKMKEILIKHDQKRTHRLKKRINFFIMANEVLLTSKDEHFQNQFQELQIEKKNIQEKLIQMQSQNSLKLYCLQNQIERLKKLIETKDIKISNLLTQIQIFVRQLNQQKQKNKQKITIISNLKYQLTRAQQKQMNLLAHQSIELPSQKKIDFRSTNILTIHPIQFPKCRSQQKLNNNVDFGTSSIQLKVKKSKTLSLFKISNNQKKLQKDEFLNKFNQSNKIKSEIIQNPLMTNLFQIFAKEKSFQ